MIKSWTWCDQSIRRRETVLLTFSCFTPFERWLLTMLVAITRHQTLGNEVSSNPQGSCHERGHMITATRPCSRYWRGSVGEVTAGCVGGNGGEERWRKKALGWPTRRNGTQKGSFQVRTGGTADMHVKGRNETFHIGSTSLVPEPRTMIGRGGQPLLVLRSPGSCVNGRNAADDCGAEFGVVCAFGISACI